MGTRSARNTRNRRPAPSSEDWREPLLARVGELERRMVLLEARFRRTVAALREAGVPEKPLEILGKRDRPRCPGCHLEIPKGKRSETCFWCGFYFAAARPMPVTVLNPAPKAARPKPRRTSVASSAGSRAKRLKGGRSAP